VDQTANFHAVRFSIRLAIKAFGARRCHRRPQLNHPQLFYSIAAKNALIPSIAECAAKPTRWSILALLDVCADLAV
jgi:hypothetical protein